MRTPQHTYCSTTTSIQSLPDSSTPSSTGCGKMANDNIEIAKASCQTNLSRVSRDALPIVRLWAMKTNNCFQCWKLSCRNIVALVFLRFQWFQYSNIWIKYRNCRFSSTYTATEALVIQFWMSHTSHYFRSNLKEAPHKWYRQRHLSPLHFQCWSTLHLKMQTDLIFVRIMILRRSDISLDTDTTYPLCLEIRQVVLCFRSTSGMSWMKTYTARKPAKCRERLLPHKLSNCRKFFQGPIFQERKCPQ